MRPTRVLLADVSPGLRDVLSTALAGLPDLVLVGDATGEVGVLLRTAEVDADIVVLEASCDVLPARAERLVDEYPHLAVLAVDLARSRGLLHRQRPTTEWIDDLQPEALVEAIRRLAAEHIA